MAAAQKLKKLQNDWYDFKRLSVAKCQLEIRSLPSTPNPLCSLTGFFSVIMSQQAPTGDLESV